MNDIFESLYKNRIVSGAIIGLFVFLLSVFLSEMESVQTLELKSYDMRFRLRGAVDISESDIAIVAFDEQSFASIPEKWPFSRGLFARAIRNLASAGARLIIFDVEISDPDYRNPRDDLQLVQAMKNAGNVLFGGSIITKDRNFDIVKPMAPILENGGRWGLMNAIEDRDGFIRQYFLFLPFKERFYFPLALVAYQNLSSTGHSATPSNSAFQIGELNIPRYRYNTMLINYRGPAGTFPTHSFEEVIDDSTYFLGKLNDSDVFDNYHRLVGTFKDKIVFVGASAEILQDNKLTPYFEYGGVKRRMPGVETHANALSTLLRGDFINRVDFRVHLLILLLCVFAVTFFSIKVRPVWGFTAVVIFMILYMYVAYVMFVRQHLWIEVVSPLVTIFFAYVGGVVQQVMTERREKGRVKRTFQQYVAKSVVDNMLETGREPEYGGERRQLTVLFSDIRSFTHFCERHSPEHVVNILNEYLTAMVDIIFANQGTLDKFVGDEIMALYGAPMSSQQHAELACSTACTMIESLRKLQKRWSQNAQDYFHIGVGVNTGNMIVGNLGSQQLFDYTVIGDEVNLAARLEGANKQYWTSIIISETTHEQIRDKAVARELDLVRVKGKRKPVKIYELRSMNPVPNIEQELLIDIYEQGLALYKQRRWYEALKQFKRILRYFPSDGPARVYIKRCLDFIESPPPANWDGVYQFTTK